MYKVIGIDEAGRGPLIGSMFVAFSIINLPSLKDLNNFDNLLKDLGVKDSKLISPKKRGLIYEELKNNLDIKYLQITPSIIDDNNERGGKLNTLEVDGIVTILNQEKPDLVIIDALTAKPEKFGDEILGKLESKDCKIISENKADAKYPIVGAASIIAKELREEEIKQIKENIKIDCGSGYTSDPKTIDFLKKYGIRKDFDFLFRKSWATYKNHIKGEVNKTLDKF